MEMQGLTSRYCYPLFLGLFRPLFPVLCDGLWHHMGWLVITVEWLYFLARVELARCLG
mgnify:CR=1 FL=1